MKVAKIELNSPAEVENEFADIVFFQGCKRDCVYCFNPELKKKPEFDHEMSVKEIAQYVYNSFSSVVVLTGGEPLDQAKTDLIEGELYYRPCDDRPLAKQWANLYKLAKKYKIELKRWKKICLTKKNSMK